MKLIAEFQKSHNSMTEVAFLFHQDPMGRIFIIDEKPFHIKLPHVYFVLMGEHYKYTGYWMYFESHLFGSVERIERLYDLVFPMPLPHVYDDGELCLFHDDPQKYKN